MTCLTIKVSPNLINSECTIDICQLPVLTSVSVMDLLDIKDISILKKKSECTIDICKLAVRLICVSIMDLLDNKHISKLKNSTHRSLRMPSRRLSFGCDEASHTASQD